VNRYAKYLLEILSSVPRGSFALPRRHCEYCGRATRFLVSGDESRSIRCLSCRATAISLASLAQIKRLPLDPTVSAVYEMSYHGVIFRYLQSHFRHFTFSEYFGPPAGGALVGGVRNEDVQRLSFADSSFDLVSCTEVFEHVPDYRLGLTEVCRVLKNDGWFIFTVPVFDDEVTRCVCRLGADGTLHWTGAPEYHDSQVTGVASVPVFWRHSKKQLPHDLKAAGFSSAAVVATHTIAPRIAQHVVVARR
jgi:SAM-dependent methyltransferase